MPPPALEPSKVAALLAAAAHAATSLLCFSKGCWLSANGTRVTALRRRSRGEQCEGLQRVVPSLGARKLQHRFKLLANINSASGTHYGDCNHLPQMVLCCGVVCFAAVWCGVLGWARLCWALLCRGVMCDGMLCWVGLGWLCCAVLCCAGVVAETCTYASGVCGRSARACVHVRFCSGAAAGPNRL